MLRRAQNLTPSLVQISRLPFVSVVMPARGAKRKAATPEQELSDGAIVTSVPKRAKSDVANTVAAGGSPEAAPEAAKGIPTNKTMPSSLSFERPQSGGVRIVAWNVCGLNFTTVLQACLHSSSCRRPEDISEKGFQDLYRS